MTIHKLPSEELLPENKSLLNRQSKVALRKLGAFPEPPYLYSLQLAELALEKGLFLANSPSVLMEAVQGMYGWPPAAAQAYLERNAQGEENDLYPRTPGKLPNPEDLAAAILGEIEHKMSLPSGSGYPAHPPAYLRDE